MNVRLEINNKILKFYTKTTGETIDFNNKEDRIKLSITILKLSDILTQCPDILEQLTNNYYGRTDLNNSYTEEFYKLIEFFFYEILHETTFRLSTELKNKIIEQITLALENSLKLKTYELNNDLENSVKFWKKFLGNEFDSMT